MFLMGMESVIVKSNVKHVILNQKLRMSFVFRAGMGIIIQKRMALVYSVLIIVTFVRMEHHVINALMDLIPIQKLLYVINAMRVV